MKIVYNNIIPFSGYKAMAIYPFLFVRKKYKNKLTKYTINHEKIHFEQQKELILIFFYILYILEWILKLFKYGNKSYNNISFEREAYNNMKDLKYLKKRKRYSFFKYFISNNKNN